MATFIVGDIHGNAAALCGLLTSIEEQLSGEDTIVEAHLRELIGEYMAHYHVERPHQGLDGAFVQPSNDHAAGGLLVKRERLGGLLNYYYREAA